jgi:hypothetical protein
LSLLILLLGKIQKADVQQYLLSLLDEAIDGTYTLSIQSQNNIKTRSCPAVQPGSREETCGTKRCHLSNPDQVIAQCLTHAPLLMSHLN